MALTGCTLKPAEFGVSTLAQAISAWTNTVGLADQVTKVYYGTAQYPTSIPSDIKTFIANNIATILCFEPTWPVVTAEVQQLINTVELYQAAGANIPCAVLCQEVNSGKTLTAAQFSGTHGIVPAFQDIRAAVPLYMCFEGLQSTQASYYSSGMFDGIGLDLYTGRWLAGNDASTANSLAIADNIPLGLFEFGTGPVAQPVSSFANFLVGAGGATNNMLSVFQSRIVAGHLIGPCAYYNGAQGKPSPNTITSSSDGRVTYLQQFFNAISSANGAGASYVIGSGQAASSGNIPVPVTIPTFPGSAIAVCGGCPNASAPIGCADTQGNQYTLIVSDATQAPGTYVFVATTGPGSSPIIPLATTDTITVAYSGSPGGLAYAIAVPDLVSSPSDVATSNQNLSSATPSITSSGLAQAVEVALAVFASGSTGGQMAWGGTNWQPQGSIQLPGSTYLTVAVKNTLATTALTPQGTLPGAATKWTGCLATLKVSIAPPTVVTILSGGLAGEAYSQALEAINGVQPYTWSVSSGSLPPGLSLSSGVISGTPTTPGTYTFTVEVTDSASQTGTLAQSIAILPVIVSTAPLTHVPGNLIPSADSGFEVSGFTWAPDVNANDPFVTGQASLTGTHCLAWTSSDQGSSSVSTDYYPCVAGDTYLAMGWMLPSGQRDCYIGVEWYDVSQNMIGAGFGPSTLSSEASWVPLNSSFAAPAGAVQFKLVAQVGESNAGDLTCIDFLGIITADYQVLVDWFDDIYAPGAQAGQFMDISPWVRLDLNITYTRGRQDGISEIQPGSGSFSLQNDTGMFTQYNTNSPIAVAGGVVDIARRCRINLTDENGIWNARFDGPISTIGYTGDNTGNTSVALVSLTDALSFLNRQGGQLCWTRETVLADAPILTWALDDAGSSGAAGVAAETSGNNGPPLRLIQSASTSGAAIAWQDSSAGIETLADAAAVGAKDGSEYWTEGINQPNSQVRGLDSGATGPYTTPQPSIHLTPSLTAQSSNNQFAGTNGYQLQAKIDQITPGTGNGYAAEIFFAEDPGIHTNAGANYGPFICLSLGSSRQQGCVVAGLWLTGTFKVDAYSQPPAFTGRNWPGSPPPAATAGTSVTLTPDKVSLPHHLVLNFEGEPAPGQSLPLGAGASVTAWLDGSEIGTFTLPAGAIFDTVVAGGAFGGLGCWWGNLQLMSLYDYQLSQAQILTHCQMGQYGMWECPTDDCIAQLAEFANVPDFWSNIQGNHQGLTLTEYQDITGNTPLGNMQLYEDAELGLLFVNSAGQITFHCRDWRMGYGAPDLYLPPDTFDADMGQQLVDQFLLNEQAVATTSFPTGTSYVNAISQGRYGTYATNGVTQGVFGAVQDNSASGSSPLTLPLVSWSRSYAQLGLPSFGFWADPGLADYCAWLANSRGTSWLVPAQVNVDLLTLDPLDGTAISDYYALDIDNMVAPSGALPVSFPNVSLSMEWFIEGITETVSVDQRTIQFYFSPAETQRAWKPGDATYGALGSTSRIGVSQADLSVPQADGKSVSHDGGPPYWPPDISPILNNPSQDSHGYIGATDIRGLTDNLKNVLEPPMLVAGAVGQAQPIASGAVTQPQIFWDTMYADTANGLGLAPGWPNWYVVTVPGFYEIDGTAVYAASSSNAGDVAQAWIVVAEQAAQAIAAGTGDPTTVDAYVCPVGEGQRITDLGFNPVCTPATRLYLGLGDMVTLATEQDTGGSYSLGTNFSGSHLALRFTGLANEDDRVQVNSSLSSGGVVVNPPQATSGSTAWGNRATYSYYGATAGSGNAYKIRSSNGSVYQGASSGQMNVTGSQFAQVSFNVAAIRAAMSGLIVTGATLHATNSGTYYKSGSTLMVGYYVDQSGGKSWVPGNNSGNLRNITQEFYSRGSTRTWTLPLEIAQAILSNANGLFIGDDSTSSLSYYGYWQGAANNWTLKFTWINP